MAQRKKAPAQAPASLVDDVVPDSPLWAQFSRIGGSLTPQQVSNIIREADVGNIARLVDLMHESRQKDCHLQSVLQTRELAVKGLTWDALAPAEKPLKREQRAAKRLRQAVQDASGFPDTVAHLVGEGTLFGFAVTQVVWEHSSDGLLVPKEFKPVSCRRFGYGQKNGRLMFDPDGFGNVDASGVDLLAEYPAGKFIFYTPRVNGDVQIREGLCRALLWAALFRNWDVRDWLMFAELAWKPLRRAVWKNGDMRKEDRAKIRQAMQAWTSSGVLTHPDSIDVFLEWNKGASSSGTSGGPHEQLARWLGEEMSKAVLGSSDIVEPGKNGARAATAERGEVRKDILEADSLGITAALTQHVARPFYEMNYGPRMRGGMLALMTEDTVNLKEFAEAVEKLVKAGLAVPANWVRDIVNMPEPEPEEEVIGGQAKEPEAKPPDPGPGSEAETEDDNGSEEAAA